MQTYPLHKLEAPDRVETRRISELFGIKMNISVDPEVLEGARALCMLRVDTRQQDVDLGDDTEDDCVITEVRPVVPPQEAEQSRPIWTDAPVLETRPPYSFKSLVIQAFLDAPEEQTGMHTFQLADKIIAANAREKAIRQAWKINKRTSKRFP
ncbi:hypothetical protein J7T55_010512 [Diaporthe amygdali]|uniref:uncharacterized protein n=1 Tax=Phomopsis amygdali TaxID=1214568 RepID=UPI0022FE6249|nr:uncharacterized protein J7T55_010512 [Diaporthe amygdali]KAJ0115689.1 hypothetical protein J7T55_010512 [Diaporthe amygdali]